MGPHCRARLATDTPLCRSARDRPSFERRGLPVENSRSQENHLKYSFIQNRRRHHEQKHHNNSCTIRNHHPASKGCSRDRGLPWPLLPHIQAPLGCIAGSQCAQFPQLKGNNHPTAHRYGTCSTQALQWKCIKQQQLRVALSMLTISMTEVHLHSSYTLESVKETEFAW